MPPTPIPVNYGIATIEYSRIDDAAQMVVTFGYHNIPSDSPDTVANGIGNIWETNFTAGMTVDTYELVGCRTLQNVGGTLQSGIFSNVIAGTNGATPPPPAICARVTKQTIYAGRAHRGRMYLPAALLDESAITDGGVIDSGQVASLQAGATGLLTDLTSANYPMYLLHHDGSTPDPVRTLEVRSTVGTQRRRQRLA